MNEEDEGIHTSGLSLVECAFGHLKSRWKILDKRLNSKISFASKMVIACVVLHNLCIHAGDYWDEPSDDEHDSDDDNNGVQFFKLSVTIR